MPIFEYRCRSCGKEFEVLQRKGKRKSCCPTCKSRNTKKLVSRFLTVQTEKQRIDNFSLEKSHDSSFYRDPRNIGLSTEHKLKKMGVDLGDAFKEKLEKARSVKNLSDVESL